MLSSSIEIHGQLNGQPVRVFTLQSGNGIEARISELGASLISVVWKEEGGEEQELTLGHESFEGWANNSSYYLGATVGRCGNRIAHGEFCIGDTRHSLSQNNFPSDIPCHLHGGIEGFHTKVWQGELLQKENRHGVRLRLASANGEEGYPGNLDVAVTYWLNEENELSWRAEATTDQPTLVNIINHTYWNLSGDLSSEITDHQIQIHADCFLPSTVGLIPTGEIRAVRNTPMDLTQPQIIGAGIDADYEPIQIAAGYDHCWVLRGYAKENTELHTAAIAQHSGTGRTLEVLTNQPGVHFYTGNFVSTPFGRRTGFCLETENFPDAPNHGHFPCGILNPGEVYQHEMVWKLS